ncbi:radical SAM protein [Bacillus sp. HMF5848]|uniref:SPL family radical SAM protein n=1 Tax=Bacillus sp. HMF5848 TaxID=2495421 RepID=UPI000F7682F5|nr:radical SAM protein [Bacillus sp. HMF5848]RSK25861.1 radical SAM protein [Bacillus sp. HMF5848]
MGVTEITVKDPLHKLKKRGVPYKYDLNAYRGCSHGCIYCYAMSGHSYLGEKDFTKEIFVKTNIAEALEKKLSSPTWVREPINLGGVCDSYQPIEKQYELMRDVLMVMIKYRNPVVISTKSSLITRDIDLIDELAHYTKVNVALCITTCDNETSKKVEPGAALPEKRLQALKMLSATKATTGLHLFPILPFLADDHDSLETIVKYASIAEADYMLTGTLYVTGGIRKRFFSFIHNNYPQYYDDYVNIYQKGGANQEYKTKVHNYLAEMRQKYQVKTKHEYLKQK